MSRSRRTHFLNDEAVQGELIFRAIIYWFFCLMTVSLMVIAWSAVTGPPRTFPQIVRSSLSLYAPAIFGSVILLPVVLLDVLKVSNRFVGPIHKVRNTLNRLANGEVADPVMLRTNDFWQELAIATNQVAHRLDWGMKPEAADEAAPDEEQEVPWVGPEMEVDATTCSLADSAN